MSNETSYRNKITYLSFILSVVVVFRHSINIDVYGLSSGFLFHFENWMREFTDLMVPMFFALSGYLFYQNFNFSIIGKKFKTRFFSLVVPYFIWNIIAYTFYLTISSIRILNQHLNQTVEPLTVSSVFENMLMGNYNITWFLRYLIIFTLIGPLFYPLMRYKKAGIALIILVFILSQIKDYGEFGYLRCFTIYLAGEYIGCNFADYVKCEYSKKQMYFCLAYIVLTTVLYLFAPYRIYIRTYSLIRISQCVAIWISADCLRKLNQPKWWAYISFFIYCSHILFLEALEKMCLMIFGTGNVGAIIDILLAAPITIVVLTTIAFFLRKAPILWGIITGNR